MGNPQVVIVRKHKKMHRIAHAAAFAATGGLSAPVTAVRAAQIAGYNQTTKDLQAGGRQPDPVGEWWQKRRLDRRQRRLRGRRIH